MSIRESVLFLVDSAIKGADLVTHIVIDHYTQNEPGDFSTEEILRVIDQLVAEGELIEIEYVLPASSYKVRSMYFPKGTEMVRRTSRANLMIDDSKIKLIKGERNGT
jgi:hypothetical protein